MLILGNLLLNIPAVTLTVANVSNTTTTNNIVTTFTDVLVISNLSTGQTTNNIALVQQNTLTIVAILNNQTTNNLNLIQQNSLVINNLLEANLNSNINLIQQNTIVLFSLTNTQVVAAITLIQQNILVLANLLLAETIPNLVFSQQNILVLSNLLQAVFIDNAIVSKRLPLDNLIINSTLSVPNLIQQNVLAINNLATYFTLATPVLTSPLFSTLNKLVLRSELPAYVELFVIDCTSIPEINTIYYITPNLNTDGVTKVNFGGQVYQPFPIQLTGLSHTSDGAYPRPRIDLANVNKVFGTLAFIYGDLVGCSITYIRTFAMYLNSNFHLSAPPLKYYIAKKLNHDTMGMSFELRSPLDKERAVLPARQMLKRDFPGLGINKLIR